MNEFTQISGLITIVFEVVVVLLGIIAAVWFSVTMAGMLVTLRSIDNSLDELVDEAEKQTICLQNLSISEHGKKPGKRATDFLNPSP